MTALLTVRALRRAFPRRGAPPCLAVDGVDLEIGAGETLALVGRSGSGKSTLTRLVLRLLRPDGGSIRFSGVDWLALPATDLRKIRRSIQAVFQEPLSSLDPRQPIGSAVAEPLRIHRPMPAAHERARVHELFLEVGLDPGLMERYPHQLSGGERQRGALARALASEPSLLIADEPLTALDAPIRSKIAELLSERKRARGLAMLFVSHDLESVRRLADRVAVMHEGRVVECESTKAVFSRPRHPATVELLAAHRRLNSSSPQFWNFSGGAT